MLTNSRAWFTIFAVAAAAFSAPAALAEDCNGNGVDDCDDIDAGMEDTNNNGLLDSCERAKGDLNLDGQVNGLDLGTLLLSWGPMPDPPGACDPVVPAWATLIEVAPDPAVVTSQALRDAITATGLAWRVRDNASNIEMLLIPPGTFNMGCSPSANYGCNSYENPVHQVTLTQAFYMGRTEVTQAQWQAEMGNNPSYYSGQPNNPVEQVSWNTIQGFLTQNSLRLPTEAEWEYACRAGTTTPFYNGSTDDSTLTTLAWYYYNTCSGGSGCGTRPVATKLPNGFGLYDTLGNVWEWCNDWDASYASAAVTNPTGPSSGSYRLLRGGGWYNNSDYCRASSRGYSNPDSAGYVIGFRVARTP